MKERLLDFAAWISAALVFAASLYFATTPPIMMAIAKNSGGQFSSVYLPMMRMIESDFNGPLLWYFNDVLGCGIEVFGEVTTPRVRHGGVHAFRLCCHMGACVAILAEEEGKSLLRPKKYVQSNRRHELTRGLAKDEWALDSLTAFVPAGHR